MKAASTPADRSATCSECWRPRVRGADADDDERHDQHRRRSAARTLSHQRAVDGAVELEGDEHDRGDLAEQAQQERGVEVAWGVVEQRDELAGAGALLVEQLVRRGPWRTTPRAASTAEKTPARTTSTAATSRS